MCTKFGYNKIETIYFYEVYKSSQKRISASMGSIYLKFWLFMKSYWTYMYTQFDDNNIEIAVEWGSKPLRELSLETTI